MFLRTFAVEIAPRCVSVFCSEVQPLISSFTADAIRGIVWTSKVRKTCFKEYVLFVLGMMLNNGKNVLTYKYEVRMSLNGVINFC